MKLFKRENLSLTIVTLVMVILTLALIGSNEILAKNLPIILEHHIIHCNIEDETYEFEYNNKEIKPEITRVVVADPEGNTKVFYGDEIALVKFSDNKEIGKADAKISFAGYQGTLLAEDVFAIVPKSVDNFTVVPESRELIRLSWDKVDQADGYYVYRSIDNTDEFELLDTISKDSELTYEDKDIRFHSLYYYYVSAYKEVNNEVFVSEPSEILVQTTPLATPSITSVKCVTHTSVSVQWAKVDGATGYQVFKGSSKNGEFKKIADIEDGTKTSYADSKCECGKEYFYYITARQTIDDVHIFGEASGIKSVKCQPNVGSLSGSISGGTKVSLKWRATVGAQGYELYKSSGNASSYELVKKFESNSETTWSEEGLEKTKSYYYKVRAYCVVGDKVIYGSFSNSYCKHAMINYNYTPGSSLDFLRQYAGIKYVYGGTSPIYGWDCSGFTQWVFKNYFGISLSRTAASQYNGGTAVSLTDRSTWKPGDLLFYKFNGKGSISHVGIYLGGGEMIHAIKKGTSVHYVDRYEVADENVLVGVRRYL